MKTIPQSKLVKKQTKTFIKKGINYYGTIADLIVEVRYDDSCGNGHNTFAITGEIYKTGRSSDNAFLAGGCVHDEIVKHFPELEPFIKWHLVSSDGPLHYISNALYHASDKDYNGYRKGEPCQFEKRIKFGNFPITYKLKSNKFLSWLEGLENYDLSITPIEHKRKPGDYAFSPKYTFSGYFVEWHYCPFNTEKEAEEFLQALQLYGFEVLTIPTEYSEGKDPNLEAARDAAKWYDAELEDFTREKLEARLPALMSEFANVVESLGFVY